MNVMDLTFRGAPGTVTGSKYLVEHEGFTTIVLESGFTDSYGVHQYVNGADGDLGRVVADGITWGFGEFAENRDLVAWLRRFNADPAHTRKVHFYGMDLPGGDGGVLPRARTERPLEAGVRLSLELSQRGAPGERRNTSVVLEANAEARVGAEASIPDRAFAFWGYRITVGDDA